MDVTKVLLILLGGALGTGCRYWLSTFVYSVVEKPSFPYANFIINVSGSFIIGMLAELSCFSDCARGLTDRGAGWIHYFFQLLT
jgi:fluoride ion exporter CrcB/FEX